MIERGGDVGNTVLRVAPPETVSILLKYTSEPEILYNCITHIVGILV